MMYFSRIISKRRDSHYLFRLNLYFYREARSSASRGGGFHDEHKHDNTETDFQGDGGSAVELVDTKASRTSSGGKLSNSQLAKLQRGLEKPAKRLLTNAERGTLDAESEDMMDLLNEALSSSHLYNLFRNTGDTSRYVEFTKVFQNQDRSHTTAMWSSTVLEQFTAEVCETKGYDEALRFTKNASAYVTARLQSREPLLRSLLTKKMDFKRVPRLLIRPADDLLGLKNSEDNDRDFRQRILREAGPNSTTKQ